MDEVPAAAAASPAAATSGDADEVDNDGVAVEWRELMARGTGTVAHEFDDDDGDDEDDDDDDDDNDDNAVVNPADGGKCIDGA